MPKPTGKILADAIRKKKAQEAAEALGIDVREAARIAANYLIALIPSVQNRHVLLEEVEQTDDGRYWLITLGYDSVSRTALLGPGLGREYKTFKLDAKTGKVLKMKIRSIN